MRSTLTVEESQERIDRLKQAIEAAKEAREYTRADVLQNCLKKEERAHQRIEARQAQADMEAKIAEYENERESEQKAIVQNVDDRLAQLEEYYAERYKELQIAHHDNIERLQDKFSSPARMTTHVSSTVRALQKAELFYAEQGDFKAAEQIKRQIQNQTKQELRDQAAKSQATIDADVAAAVTVYQGQQKSFAQRLLNDRNVLKRDIEREILAIQNKYKKRYHNLTGKSEQEFDLTSRFQKRLFLKIDREIQAFAMRMQAMYKVPGTLPDEEGDDGERRKPVSAPRSRPVSGRKSTREAESPRRSQTVRGSSRRSASVRGGSRNPRLDAALSRTNRNIDLAGTLV